MSYNVKFLKGTAAQYNGLNSNIDANTFYYVDNKDLYLGSIKLSNAADLASAVSRITTNETDIADIKASLEALIGGESGSISEMINTAINSLKDELQPQITANKNAIDAINNTTTGILAKAKEYADAQDTAKIGSLSSLTTDAKDTVVAAINEVDANVTALKTSSAVTISTEETTAGMLKSYTVKQGNKQIGVIDIPKDMVVKSGEVKVNPEGRTAGTYIVLTLANATEDKIYVNVGRLVDIYTAQAKASKVQLAINPSTREISASIVAGSIGAADLATNAITTDKIADKNVTKAKLADNVQASLGKADSAVQTIAESTVNGSILVDGAEVAVHGLGSAAYANAEDFDAIGSATSALNSAKAYTNAEIQKLDANVTSTAVDTGKGLQVQVVEADGKITSVAVSGDYSNTYDAKGAATKAETNAKAYTDTALTWGSIG